MWERTSPVRPSLALLDFALLALALVLASCSPGRVAPPAKAPGKETVIKVYSWDNEYAIKAATEAFNARASGIRVDLVQVPWKEYQNKLFVSLSGGEDIDVYFIREMEAFYGYVRKGLAYPLDELIARHGFDTAPYEPYVEQLKVEGRTYALPYRGAGLYLFYNKNAFDEAGIPYPEGSYSWARYRKVAKALTKGSGTRKRYGSFFEPSMYHWPIMKALQSGIRIVDDFYRTDIDSPLVKEALVYYRTLTDVDESQPTLAEIKAANMSTTSVFVPGKVAMVMAGEWFVGRLNAAKESGELKFDWGMDRIPCDGKEYVSGGLATKGSVNAATKHPEAAFAYLSWVAGMEGQKVIAAAGSKPALLTPETEEILSRQMGLDKKSRRVFFESPPVANQPINRGATYAKQILVEELTACLTGAQGVDETIARCRDRLEAALAEFR